jgi:hypothetical protein
MAPARRILGLRRPGLVHVTAGRPTPDGLGGPLTVGRSLNQANGDQDRPPGSQRARCLAALMPAWIQVTWHHDLSVNSAALTGVLNTCTLTIPARPGLSG